MEPPIESILPGERLEIAKMQDTLVTMIYDYVQPDAIMHGGTAIWRCYGGGRFSEDIDIYVDNTFEKRLYPELRKRNIEVVWKDEDLPLHMKLSDGSTQVLLEASIGRYESSSTQYIRADGSSITVTTLSPTELLARKIEAYEGRRYIRDIYDIMHLTNYLHKDDTYVISKMKPFLKNIKKPVDEKILRSLIYKGNKKLTFDEMVGYLRGWIDEV